MDHTEQLVQIRSSLVEQRDDLEGQIEKLDEKIALLDHLIALDRATDPGRPKKAPAPPAVTPAARSTRKVPAKKKSEHRSAAGPAGGNALPLRPPRKVVARTLPPKDSPDESSDAGEPQYIGTGEKDVPPDTNLAAFIDAIAEKAPHWVSYNGMVDDANAKGREVPKTYRVILGQIGSKLCTGEYCVPGLQHRKNGMRAEFRILVDESGAKETEQ